MIDPSQPFIRHSSATVQLTSPRAPNMARRSSDQHEEPWHANGPSSRGVKRPSSGDDTRATKVAPAWGGDATSDVTSAGVGFTCAGPLQRDPFICPPARRPSPVGFVMRPGPESEYDPQVRGSMRQCASWRKGVGVVKVGLNKMLSDRRGCQVSFTAPSRRWD